MDKHLLEFVLDAIAEYDRTHYNGESHSAREAYAYLAAQPQVWRPVADGTFTNPHDDDIITIAGNGTLLTIEDDADYAHTDLSLYPVTLRLCELTPQSSGQSASSPPQ